MVHFGPFWPEEVHFGPFRSANCTLAIPEKFQGKTPWVDSACADCPGLLVLGAVPGFHLRLGASDCSSGLAFCLVGPWRFAWISRPHLPHHRTKTKKRTAHVFAAQGGTRRKLGDSETTNTSICVCLLSSEDFSLLVAFLLVTFSWLFRGFFVAFFVALFCLEKTVFGPFSLLFRVFFVAFSWPPFWANFTRTRPGTVF